eukprot:PhF_6_TR25377/c0_g1_i2/m.35100/K11599/POMP, UMP1; proteasome maturation protein
MESAHCHPVQAIHLRNQQDDATRLHLMQTNFGWALPAHHLIQETILSQIGRMGGLESSHVTLESTRDTLETIELRDVMNLPSHKESVQPAPYVLLQRQYGILQ